MIVDRLLDLPRHPRMRRLRRRLGLDDRRLADIYWRLLSPFVPKVSRLTVDGRTFEFGVSHLPEHYLFEHFDEEAQLADFATETGSEDVVWDIGANVGVYTVVGAAAGADVYAFEPFPPNVARLRANLRRNGVEATVDSRAITAASGTVHLRASSPLPGAQGSGVVDATSPSPSAHVVQAVAGDDVDHPPPTVLKIDVEGAEADVIAGMIDTMQRETLRVVYLEVHRDRLPAEVSPESLRETLQEHGFSVDPIGPQFDHRLRWKGTR